MDSKPGFQKHHCLNLNKNKAQLTGFTSFVIACTWTIVMPLDLIFVLYIQQGWKCQVYMGIEV